jgi:PKD repeat protein
MPYGKNSHNNYIELEKSKNFPTPSDYRSSTRKMSQAKRERAAFKGGKENIATNLSVCESGFENSIVIAYTIPSIKSNEETQTGIIQTDSFFSPQYEKFPVGYNTISGSGVTMKGEFPFVIGSDNHINQVYKIDTFLLTEKNSDTKTSSSKNFDSLIAANTDMRNKFSWHPFIDGQAKLDANFSTLSKAFKGTRFNSYTITDQATQLFNVGYADPGAILVRSIPLSTTNINAPITDKTIFVDGIPPTYLSDFRLLEPIATSGAAVSSFPTITQISSREYVVAYSLNASPRKINFKLISNYQLQNKNTLLDLDAMTGNTLSDKYNIYGLTSDYDEKLKLHRSVFWCNGGIYYFEYPVSSIVLGKIRFDRLHLVKGKLDEDLVSELLNRKNIVTYYDSNSDLNNTVPKQRPALMSCKKPEYNGKVFVAYDTGKCYIESVLFHPYSKISGIRKFDIECVNDSSSIFTDNIKNNLPIADIQSNPTSGQSALLVNFLSSNSYDPNGSTLTYTWNFGDETQSTEENPVHTFINNTANPIQFKVTLIVTNINGLSSDPASITITVNPAPVNNLLPQAKFTATPTTGTLPLLVTFTDQSTPVNDGSVIQLYEWDFGDTNTALKLDSSSFTHEYTIAGTYVPTLIIKDSTGRVSSKFYGTPIKVDGTVNNPPSPGFNWAQTSYSPNLKIQFTDTSSDVEGPLVAWHWDFADKQTADVQNPEHIYADPGKYLVTLTITDSGGLQVSGSKEITVLPPGNNPPIANFTYLQQNRKLVIDFTDISMDTDGTIVSWNWDFGDKTTDTTKNPSHTYAFAGTYQVALSVTDNGGKTGSITIRITVNPLVNQPPVISNITGTQTSFKPSIGTFSETSSDPDGFISQWDWNFGDGQVFSTTNIALKNPTHIYANPGTYTVTLTVTDDGLPDGTNKRTTTSSIPNFVISPPPANIPPVALFTVDTNNAFAPLKVNFTDNSTDADGKIVSWLWEFETGSTLFSNAQTYQKIVSHIFTKSGTYPVKLTVTDDGNLTNSYILNIVVKNNPPVPILFASPNPVLSLLPVSFFGNNSYDTDGNITKYAWDFGDGTTIQQGTTAETHTYSKPGSYKASLTVTDNIGDSSTANLIITVTNRNPEAKITYTSLNVKAPGNLTFNGDTSSDSDGIIVSYNWTVSNGLSATTPNATFNFTNEGTYTVTLTVTDDSGGANSTSVTVTVTPADNILPIAILSANKNLGIINDSFIFNVSNSYDPDGSITLYQLDFGDGTSTQFVNPAPIFHIYKTVGVFTAKLIATDNRSGVSLETVNSVQKITINNQPPVANFSFSPISAFTFDPITFTDNSSDPENALSKWSWNYGDGTSFTTSDPLQKNPTKSYSDGNKDYTVYLTVYDNFGLSNTTSHLVHINNRKPFAVISTSSTPINNTIVGIAPFTVFFDSSSYDLDGTVVNYEWYLNGISGTPITTKSFAYTFTSARFTPYVVTLRVQDDDGDWSDSVYIGVKVNVPNTPPIAVISANPPSRTRQAPITVDFSGAGSYDPDNVGGPLIYSWDFGNGNTSDAVNASTVYSQPGTYKVSLIVTDNLAAINTATLDYIVLNNKPIALIDTLPSGIVSIRINTPIVFTSSGSYDTDTNQFINGYKWLKDGVNQNSNTPTFETSFDSVGNHTITLSVFDNLGLESNLVSKTVYVFTDPIPTPNQNPIAILGNEPGITGYIELKVGDSFTFDGTTSYDPEDGFNITYEWSIGGVKSGFNSTFTNQFSTVGIFAVSLVVFDTKKLSSTSATNLGKRYTVNVNVSTVLNPLANKLFSSGQALYGAISSNSNAPDRYGFQLVDDTKQYTIIESGLYHSFVVDADGKLYASGLNSNGQLGFPSNITQQNSFTLVPLASKYKVVKVSAGDYCSAIIAEDTTLNKRVLLVCGSNINGIFGQALPRTNIYSFQPILERATTNNGASYLSNNSFLDVSCNSYILAFTDNRKVWVAGTHNYVNKTGINDTGFFPVNIDPNPDTLLGSINYLNPFKLEVGFNNLSGFVTGLSYDIDNQIVWFTGLSSLRGWGYAYDISTYENSIVVITASLDPYFDHAIYLYFFSYNEIPQFNVSGGLVSDTNPGLNPPENFLKVSTGKFGYLAISENLYFPYGLNDYGQLGYEQSVSNSNTLSLRAGYQDGQVLPNMSVKGTSDIAAGGNHSIILASNIRPSSYSFTITKPGGYATDPQYPTAYPITQIAG